MDEDFVAELSIPDASAAFGVVHGTPSVATVTIEDNDGQYTLCSKIVIYI